MSKHPASIPNSLFRKEIGILIMQYSMPSDALPADT